MQQGSTSAAWKKSGSNAVLGQYSRLPKEDRLCGKFVDVGCVHEVEAVRFELRPEVVRLRRAAMQHPADRPTRRASPHTHTRTNEQGRVQLRRTRRGPAGDGAAAA